MSVRTISELQQQFARHGIRTLYVKHLARKQDNDKNQIYLGTGLDGFLNLFAAQIVERSASESTAKRKSKSGKPKLETRIELSWWRDVLTDPMSDPFVILLRVRCEGSDLDVIWIMPRSQRNCPVDIAGYASSNAAFPQQSTGDQFFDSAQWEAYRKLGELSATRLVIRVRACLQVPHKPDASRLTCPACRLPAARRRRLPLPGRRH